MYFFLLETVEGAILYIRLISAVVYLQSVLYVYPFFITLRVMILIWNISFHGVNMNMIETGGMWCLMVPVHVSCISTCVGWCL